MSDKYRQRNWLQAPSKLLTFSPLSAAVTHGVCNVWCYKTLAAGLPQLWCEVSNKQFSLSFPRQDFFHDTSLSFPDFRSISRERVDYKLCATVHRCLQCKAPPYLTDLCIPVSDVASRQRLRSASSNQLVVPRHRRTQFGRRAFSVAGPMVWNALPDSIRDTALSAHSFRRNLKTLLFSFY